MLPFFSSKQEIQQLTDHLNLRKACKQGFTALHIAAEFNETDIAALPIAKDANVNAKSDGHLTSLHCSFEKKNLEMSLILSQSGVSLIDKDEKGKIAMESNGSHQNYIL